MASAEALDRKVRQKVAGTGFVLAPRKVMRIVQEVRGLKNARSHPAPMLYPARSGSVVVRSPCDD